MPRARYWPSRGNIFSSCAPPRRSPCPKMAPMRVPYWTVLGMMALTACGKITPAGPGMGGAGGATAGGAGSGGGGAGSGGAAGVGAGGTTAGAGGATGSGGTAGGGTTGSGRAGGGGSAAGGTTGGGGSAGHAGGGAGGGSAGHAGGAGGGAAGSSGAAGAGGGFAGAGGAAGACDLSKPFGTAVLAPGINSSFNEYAIWINRDGLSAIVASDRTDLGGPGKFDLYGTTRASTSAAFGLPTLLPNVNTADTETKPVVSPDGLQLYFSSDRPGAGTGYDIYVATRLSLVASFGVPSLVTSVSSTAGDLLGSLTADGQYLYFDRPASGTGRDIYVKNLRTADPPVSVDALNSKYDEGHAVLSDDQLTVYFASTRVGLSTSGGSADANILVAHRSTVTDMFGDPALVSELNTSNADIPSYLSPDGCTLYFDSDRSGSQDLWVATKPKN